MTEKLSAFEVGVNRLAEPGGIDNFAEFAAGQFDVTTAAHACVLIE